MLRRATVLRRSVVAVEEGYVKAVGLDAITFALYSETRVSRKRRDMRIVRADRFVR